LPLALGSRLGVYEVTSEIGAGGMGQVYRATDTALGRQVAIKILPDAFASDPDRLARFEREARTLASLDHSHIATIYAVERSAGLTHS
jgi:serine/threonine protein kinase